MKTITSPNITTFIMNNGVQVTVPKDVLEFYEFGAQSDNAGIRLCIGEAIGLSEPSVYPEPEQ